MAAKSCIPATLSPLTRMFRILQRTRQRTKTPKDQRTRCKGHHQGQARDHCELPTKQAIASSPEDQESSLSRGDNSTNNSYEGELDAIPSSLELLNNCFYFKGIKVRVLVEETTPMDHWLSSSVNSRTCLFNESTGRDH